MQTLKYILQQGRIQGGGVSRCPEHVFLTRISEYQSSDSRLMWAGFLVRALCILRVRVAAAHMVYRGNAKLLRRVLLGLLIICNDLAWS